MGESGRPARNDPPTDGLSRRAGGSGVVGSGCLYSSRRGGGGDETAQALLGKEGRSSFRGGVCPPSRSGPGAPPPPASDPAPKWGRSSPPPQSLQRQISPPTPNDSHPHGPPSARGPGFTPEGDKVATRWEGGWRRGRSGSFRGLARHPCPLLLRRLPSFHALSKMPPGVRLPSAHLQARSRRKSETSEMEQGFKRLRDPKIAFGGCLRRNEQTDRQTGNARARENSRPANFQRWGK